MTINLSKTAMLVSVKIINGGLLGERKDAAASALVQNTYACADKRTKASKYLIDRQHKSVKQVVAAGQRVREIVYKYTSPWGEDTRLLAVKNADRFKAKIGTAIAELVEARENYILHFPALVLASKADLGPLFDPSQYPDIDRVRDLFKHRVTYWPMPESGHFVADISKEAARQAKHDIEAEMEDRLLEATYDMVARAKEVVSKFVDKLEKFKINEETNKPETIFRDSLLGNISETSQLIFAMNLTNNPQINKVIKDLDRLVNMVSIRGLRSSSVKGPEYRQKALTAGQEVLINLAMLDLKDKEVSDMVADAGEYM